MIIIAIITAMFWIVQGVLYIVPDLPSTPAILITTGSWLVGTIYNVVSVFKMLYTPTLFNAIITILIGILLFDQLYWLMIWILKKLHIVG